jgi:hypothetical protein
MPPYKDGKRPQPKQQTGLLVVSVPLCKWCRIRVGFPCKVCGIHTCYMCLRDYNTNENRCVHQIYKPVPNDGWGEECPNPMCDVECNVCMGRGII